jgi:hypothetical protein
MRVFGVRCGKVGSRNRGLYKWIRLPAYSFGLPPPDHPMILCPYWLFREHMLKFALRFPNAIFVDVPRRNADSPRFALESCQPTEISENIVEGIKGLSSCNSPIQVVVQLINLDFILFLLCLQRRQFVPTLFNTLKMKFSVLAGTALTAATFVSAHDSLPRGPPAPNTLEPNDLPPLVGGGCGSLGPPYHDQCCKQNPEDPSCDPSTPILGGDCASRGPDNLETCCEEAEHADDPSCADSGDGGYDGGYPAGKLTAY